MLSHPISGAWLAGILLSIAATHASAVASFDIVVDNDFAQATNVSPDGNWVVGSEAAASGSAYRWSSGTLQTLTPGSSGAGAGGASQDGSVVVGEVDGDAFRWQGTLVLLDHLPGQSSSSASDISADASTIVGRSGNLAFIHQGGTTSSLGDLGGGSVSSRANAVSQDGSVIVGRGNSTQGDEAFRWQGGTMTGLGDLSGGLFGSEAFDVTLDGSVVVGSSEGANGLEAFRWESGAMTPLGQLGTGESEAFSVSADGNTIVGSAGPGVNSRAFIWDPGNGMRFLDVVLGSLGIDLSGIDLRSALGVSADGKTLVGHGFDNNGLGEEIGWVATIPEPGTGALLALGLSGLAAARRRGRA